MNCCTRVAGRARWKEGRAGITGGLATHRANVLADVIANAAVVENIPGKRWTDTAAQRRVAEQIAQMLGFVVERSEKPWPFVRSALLARYTSVEQRGRVGCRHAEQTPVRS